MFRYKLFPNSPIYFNALPPAQYFGPQVPFVRNPDGTYEPAPKPEPVYHHPAPAPAPAPPVHIPAQDPAPAIVAAQPPRTENIPPRSGRIQPFINQVIELRNKRNRESAHKFPHAHPLDFTSAFNSALQSGVITAEDAPFIIEDLYNQGLVNFGLPQTEYLMTKYKRAPGARNAVPELAANPMAEAQRPVPGAQMQRLASREMRPAAPILNIIQQQGNVDRNIIPPYIRALRQAAENPPIATQYVNRGPNRRERMQRVMQHLDPTAYAGEIPEEDEE
jgi:hypothetical protein